MRGVIIASFFRNIGYADQLGSGVRNLFKYSKFYSGQNPQFVEGDVFRIIVPLDDEYSFDFGSMKVESGISDTNSLLNESENADKMPTDATKSATDATKSATELELTEDEKKILSMIEKNPRITQKNSTKQQEFH